MNAKHFHVNGHKMASNPYHYTECGLDNIYLANGFHREVFDGEEYISIDNVDGLWKAIGFSLVCLPRILEPKEIKFLRQQMGKTQAELAQLLRVDTQTVARWEKGKSEMPGPADIAIRFLMLGSPVMQPEGSEVLEKVKDFMQSITDRDDDTTDCTTFTQANGGWHQQMMAA